MRNILMKEIKLSSSILSFLFTGFGLMFLLPGYPVLCGAFFVCLGIFQSFQNSRETNDIVFSALLPIAKADIVKGKYLFVCFIQALGFLFMALCTVLRMTLLSQAAVYRENALMNANPFALGMALLVFAVFNAVFVGGFFKTGYKFTRPFVGFIIAGLLVIICAEAAHHIPGLEAVNAFGAQELALQLALLAVCVVIYAAATGISCRISCGRFEKTDL